MLPFATGLATFGTPRKLPITSFLLQVLYIHDRLRNAAYFLIQLYHGSIEKGIIHLCNPLRLNRLLILLKIDGVCLSVVGLFFLTGFNREALNLGFLQERLCHAGSLRIVFWLGIIEIQIRDKHLSLVFLEMVWGYTHCNVGGLIINLFLVFAQLVLILNIYLLGLFPLISSLL